jgi:hypothetical protein
VVQPIAGAYSHFFAILVVATQSVWVKSAQVSSITDAAELPLPGR